MTDIPALLIALRSKDTPIAAKIFAGITVAYALSPIDLIPDFLPVIGYLDDILLLPLLIVLTVRLIPADAFARYRKEAEGMWRGGKPKRWYFAVPVALVWLLVVWLVVKAIFF